MKMELGNPAFRRGCVLLNLISFVGGCIIIGMGIDILTKFIYYFDDIECYTYNCIMDLIPFWGSLGLEPQLDDIKRFYLLFGGVIFVGILITFVPAIGFCAVYSGRKRVIIIFACFIFIAVIMEIALLVVLRMVTLDGIINNFIEARDKERTVRNDYADDYYDHADNDYDDDALQREFKCCGEDGHYYCSNPNMTCKWDVTAYFEQRKNVLAWTVIVTIVLQFILLIKMLFLQNGVEDNAKDYHKHLFSFPANDWHFKPIK